MEKDSVKIVLTGGHAGTTALAVIEEILKRGKENWKISWIGPKTVLEGKKIIPFEHRIFPGMGVSSHSITAGKLQRKFNFWAVVSFLKVPIGFVNAFWVVLRIRPSVIVSFGGYAGVPVVFAGWLLGVPIILHEQTMVVGLANKLSSFFASKVAISRMESADFFPKNKIVLTGNPVMAEIVKVGPKNSLSSRPVVFITGGSRGAQNINNVVDGILDGLVEKFDVIHHTGYLDFERFRQRKEKLGRNYDVFDFIDPLKMGEIYKKSDIIVGRAGANSISEIMATGRPAILIPIPWTRFDEQTKNARLAEKCGIGVILPQDDLSPVSLLAKIEEVLGNWREMVLGMDRSIAKMDIGASAKLVDVIESQLS